ncbi:metallophosphoesterase [Bacillus pacificus]|uniref:metallophosphoesterase n=1 Tax=Bacillus pacificus TaxID=2026187 RepID=UPI00156ABE38|nr:metallophosphoesterase [Bacillus pacificus]NRR17650.1 metallophosphoesterase [Bacillus pacificus]
MKKFTIIHLSDLHISAEEEGTLERMRESLIRDAKRLIANNNLSIDAVVMTGDTVDRGGNDNSFKKAEEFYQRKSQKMKKIFMSTSMR